MTTLIIADDIRKYCLGKAKFDTARFDPFLEPAELDYIKPFLGDDFYAEIRTQYLASTLTANNHTLITDYLAKPLAWHTLAKALPFLNVDISNSGLLKNTTDFSSQSSKDERADLVSSALSNAQVYLEKAKAYIEKEQLDNNKFPLYAMADNIDNDTKIIGGIVFDDLDE